MTSALAPCSQEFFQVLSGLPRPYQLQPFPSQARFQDFLSGAAWLSCLFKWSGYLCNWWVANKRCFFKKVFFKSCSISAASKNRQSAHFSHKDLQVTSTWTPWNPSKRYSKSLPPQQPCSFLCWPKTSTRYCRDTEIPAPLGRGAHRKHQRACARLNEGKWSTWSTASILNCILHHWQL